MWDLNSLVAIDIHTHAHTPPEAADPEELAQRAAMKAYFGQKGEELTTPAIAAYYRERKIGCVIFTVDSEKESGHRRYPNEEVASVAAENSDIMIAFGSIDPAKGRAGAKEARRLVREFGVKGFKFHPSTRASFPTTAVPMCSMRRSPKRVRSRSSTAARPASAPACREAAASGSNIPTRCTSTTWRSIPRDEDHHRAPVIPVAGGGARGRPAQAQCLHRPVGLVAEIFPADFVHYANTLLRKKVLFGSDYPALTPDRWIADFQKLDIRPEVRPLILKENAAQLLGLK